MLIIIFVLCLIFLISHEPHKQGGGQQSIYVVEKIKDPEIINYQMPAFCNPLPRHHLTLHVPIYENADQYAEYYRVIRNEKVRFMLPVMPAYCHFLAAYWFIKIYHFHEIIMLDAYAGTIQKLLVTLFKIKIHYFTTKEVPAIKNVIHYKRLPNAVDFKNLKGLPLVNLSIFLYKQYTPDTFVNGCMFTNRWAADIIEKFRPVHALSELTAHRFNFKLSIRAGNNMLFPFRSCTSNQRFYHVCSINNPMTEINLLPIFGSICVFDFCVRNLVYSTTKPTNWDVYLFRALVDPQHVKKIISYMGDLPKALYNDPAGMDHVRPRHLDRFLDKIPGDLNLQNSYVSAFCDDIDFNYEPVKNYEFLHTTKGLATIVYENFYKTINKSVAGLKLTFVVPNYYSSLFMALIYNGIIWCPEPITDYIKVYVNNSNYFTFKKGIPKKSDVNFINYKTNKTSELLIKQGAEYLRANLLPNVRRIWIEKNDAAELLADILHAAYPDAILLMIGYTGAYRYFIINYPNIENIMSIETGDVIWKIV